MVIYKATNNNGKVYIGQTIHSLVYRKMQHKYDVGRHRKLPFYNALNKYGFDSFKWQVICICPNINSLNEQEEYYITYYNSINSGYNLKSGGLNNLYSKKSREKMSNSAKGKKVSSETRKKLSDATKGEKHWNYGGRCSEEHKKILSKANRGYKHTPEAIEKIRQASIGRKCGDRSGKNNSMYGKKMSEEAKEKLRQINLGKKHSEATKKKISKANKGRILSQETRKKMCKPKTEATKQKMRLAQRKRFSKIKEKQYG